MFKRFQRDVNNNLVYGESVFLTATPEARLLRWSPLIACSSGIVFLEGDLTCTAEFTPETCENNSQCPPGGYRCRSGTCYGPCASAADCPTGQVCLPDGACGVPGPTRHLMVNGVRGVLVTSNPPGIYTGCAGFSTGHMYVPQGTQVELIADINPCDPQTVLGLRDTTFQFVGWKGGWIYDQDCEDGHLSMASDLHCVPQVEVRNGWCIGCCGPFGHCHYASFNTREECEAILSLGLCGGTYPDECGYYVGTPICWNTANPWDARCGLVSDLQCP